MVKGRQEACASLMPILCHRFADYRRGILGVPGLQSLQPSPASDGAPAGSRDAATAVFGSNYLKSYECSPKY